MTGLSMIFDPASVAIVGASRQPGKRGYRAVQRLIEDGFAGRIYPVTPQTDEILGLKAYPSIGDVPDDVDLALIVRPALDVPRALEACGEAGVKGAVILAVGFRESGDAGQSLETEIVSIARRYGIRMIGPNTSGIFNTHKKLNLVGIGNVVPGSISVLSQSGNVILGLINETRPGNGLGFATYVGLGNEAEVGFHECLAELRADDRTKALIVYAEGFRDGRAFLQELRRTAVDKPVVIYKAGRSEIGSRSAASHTGALAGSFEVAHGALRQAGAVSVRRSDELLAVAEALTMSRPMIGDRVAVVADGGGHATMAADALVEFGMSVTILAQETQQALCHRLGGAAAVQNPIDVAGAADTDPGVFEGVVGSVIHDPNIDGVLLVGLFGGYAERFSPDLEGAEQATAAALVRLVQNAGKPIVVQSVYAGTRPAAHDVLRRGGIPVYQSIDVATRCLTALSERGTFLTTHTERSDLIRPNPVDTPELAPVGGMLPEHEARELLSRHGIPVAPWELAKKPTDAEQAAARFGGRVAMKVVSPDVVHKSDAGGVMLDVTPGDAAEAFESITDSVSRAVPDARIQGILVSPMAHRGLELIVGMTHDPNSGPVLMLGLGGVMVDAIGGAAFRVLPMTWREAWELSGEFHAASALKGFRGYVPDRNALVELLVKASNLVVAEPAIEEFDFNPVVLGSDGAVVVDARVVLRRDMDGAGSSER